MYILITASEDGNPNTFLHEPIGEFLNNALGDYGITEFMDLSFLNENPDPMYWREGIAVLAKFEVVVPKPVTSKWSV